MKRSSTSLTPESLLRDPPGFSANPVSPASGDVSEGELSRLPTARGDAPVIADAEVVGSSGELPLASPSVAVPTGQLTALRPLSGELPPADLSPVALVSPEPQLPQLPLLPVATPDVQATAQRQPALVRSATVGSPLRTDENPFNRPLMLSSTAGGPTGGPQVVAPVVNPWGLSDPWFMRLQLKDLGLNISANATKQGLQSLVTELTKDNRMYNLMSGDELVRTYEVRIYKGSQGTGITLSDDLLGGSPIITAIESGSIAATPHPQLRTGLRLHKVGNAEVQNHSEGSNALRTATGRIKLTVSPGTGTAEGLHDAFAMGAAALVLTTTFQRLVTTIDKILARALHEQSNPANEFGNVDALEYAMLSRPMKSGDTTFGLQFIRNLGAFEQLVQTNLKKMYDEYSVRSRNDPARNFRNAISTISNLTPMMPLSDAIKLASRYGQYSDLHRDFYEEHLRGKTIEEKQVNDFFQNMSTGGGGKGVLWEAGLSKKLTENVDTPYDGTDGKKLHRQKKFSETRALPGLSRMLPASKELELRNLGGKVVHTSGATQLGDFARRMGIMGTTQTDAKAEKPELNRMTLCLFKALLAYDPKAFENLMDTQRQGGNAYYNLENYLRKAEKGFDGDAHCGIAHSSNRETRNAALDSKLETLEHADSTVGKQIAALDAAVKALQKELELEKKKPQTVVVQNPAA